MPGPIWLLFAPTFRVFLRPLLLLVLKLPGESQGGTWLRVGQALYKLINFPETLSTQKLSSDLSPLIAFLRKTDCLQIKVLNGLHLYSVLQFMGGSPHTSSLLTAGNVC